MSKTEETNLFFLVFSRDRTYVAEKILELDGLNVPYAIVCGEHMNHPKVSYRAPKGKYDAVNFGAKLIPRYVDVVVMNDADTRIGNFRVALQRFEDERADILFATEMVKEGPQTLFFRLFNPIRRRIPLAATGELMLVKRELLEIMLPLKPCKAEDSYMLFQSLEMKRRVVFCEECFAETRRTRIPEEEEAYKRRTTAGIYQALSYTGGPRLIKFFYSLLPFMSPLLLVLGKRGYYWMRGILLGFLDYVRGDRTGFWRPTYLDSDDKHNRVYLGAPGETRVER